jgi:hypothetical protein
MRSTNSGLREAAMRASSALIGGSGVSSSLVTADPAFAPAPEVPCDETRR